MEIHNATTASGHAALFGFVGLGPEQRATAGEAAIARASIEQFACIFGPEALRPRATLYKDWTADPLTASLLMLVPSVIRRRASRPGSLDNGAGGFLSPAAKQGRQSRATWPGWSMPPGGQWRRR